MRDVKDKLLIQCCKKTSTLVRAPTVQVLKIMDDIYSKCLLIAVYGHSKSAQDLSNAQNVFDSIAMRHKDANTITAMMKCLVAHARYTCAIAVFNQFNMSHLVHNHIANTLFLKACIYAGDNHHYSEAQSLIDQYLPCDAMDEMFATAAIQLYGCCGRVSDAFNIFQSIPTPKRNIVCVSMMLKCFVDNQQCARAMEVYKQCRIQHSNVSHNLFLHACIAENCYRDGQTVLDEHFAQAHTLCQQSIELITTAIRFYSHFGSIDDACQVFASIAPHKKDTLSTNAMMKCHLDHGRFNDAIHLYRHSQVARDDVSHLLFLKACMGMRDDGNDRFGDAKTIVSQCTHNLQQRSNELINTVIHFYGHYGRVDDALQVFNAIPVRKRDSVAVNAMMTAFVDNLRCHEAIAWYQQLRQSGVDVDDVCNLLFLKACVHAQQYADGKQLIDACDVSSASIAFINTVIDFYGHFGHVVQATTVFDSIPAQTRDVVTVNAMMTCLMANAQYTDAIRLFATCDSQHNAVTKMLYIKCCMRDKHYHYSECVCVIDEYLRTVHEPSVEFMATAIDCYAHYGQISDAFNVFSRTRTGNNVAVVGAMMNAYHINGQWQESLSLFDEIPNHQRNAYCYIFALNACGSSVSVERGLQIISDLRKHENVSLLNDPEIQAAIIRFYVKTRDTQTAIDTFEAIMTNTPLLERDKNGSMHCAILDCYAKTGDTDKMLSLFHKIKMEGRVKISDMMYSILLNGFSHSGLVDEAQRIFEEIVQNESTARAPSKCIVAMMDCLARKQHIDDAERFYHAYKDELHFRDRFMALMALLSSCRLHNKDFQTAERIFAEIQHVFCPFLHQNEWINEYISSAHALMENIYAQNTQRL